MKPVKTIFIGSSYEGESTLRDLHESDKYDMVGVITQPDKPAGRRAELTPTRIKQVATELGIRIFEPNSNEDNYKRIVEKHKPELIITIAFGEFIPDVVLDYPKYKCLNIHYSLLPLLRGACPVQIAIKEGHKKTGLTIQIMEAEMDKGPILAQEEVEISNSDTTDTLKQKLIPAGNNLIIEMLPKWIAGRIKPQEQDNDNATYCYKKDMSKQNAQVDWKEESPEEIERKVRAFNPWPIAWTEVEGKRLKLYKVQPTKYNHKSKPGKLIDLKGEPAFSTKDSEKTVVLRSVQLEGKKQMSGKDFLRGWNLGST